MSKKKKAAFFSLGCKVNQYETAVIEQEFFRSGYDIVDFEEIADIYIVNTCTVTNMGDKKSRQVIRKAKFKNPQSIVVAAGCYSQVYPDDVKKIEGINIVLGVDNISNIVSIVENYIDDTCITGYGNESINESGVYCEVNEIENSIIYEDTTNFSGFKERTRAYIKIEDGCNNFCSYCIIPYARGSVRSRDIKSILEEAKLLAQKNIKEVVLTGIHIASYGYDLEKGRLEDVVKDINNIDGIERIRLGSIEPMIITERFLDALSNLEKFCRHFHLSLQSGCDKILKAMNRNYTSEQYLNCVKLIKQYFPDAAIWTDLITGFPGETNQDFLESNDFVRNSGIVKLHVFPYAQKKGTAAYSYINQVDTNIKKERAKIISKLSDNLYTDFLKKNIGTNSRVLFEKARNDGLIFGHTSNYIGVYSKSKEDVINTLKEVKLVSIVEKNNIEGEIVFA